MNPHLEMGVSELSDTERSEALAQAQRELNAERERPLMSVAAFGFASFPRPAFGVIVAVVARQFQASEEQVRTWIMAVPESER